MSEVRSNLLHGEARESSASWRATSRVHVAPEALHDETLATMAVRALIDEAELTPKPALVDRRGSGAHDDLDLDLMRRSARSLHGGFATMARQTRGKAVDQALREALARVGRDAERTMMGVTRGSNAHRGAIWLLGLLVAGAAQQDDRTPARIAASAARIASFEDRYASTTASNGRRAALRYGARGARGEAEDAFPHAVSIGLPALRHARRSGVGEEAARLDALLSIMVSLTDTCLLHRGGQAALAMAQAGAQQALEAGGSSTPAGMKRLLALDTALVARNASPGGAADLLAATLFLDRLEWADGESISLSHASDTQWKP